MHMCRWDQTANDGKGKYQEVDVIKEQVESLTPDCWGYYIALLFKDVSPLHTNVAL